MKESLELIETKIIKSFNEMTDTKNESRTAIETLKHHMKNGVTDIY